MLHYSLKVVSLLEAKPSLVQYTLFQRARRACVDVKLCLKERINTFCLSMYHEYELQKKKKKWNEKVNKREE